MSRPRIFFQDFADVAKRSRVSEVSQYWNLLHFWLSNMHCPTFPGTFSSNYYRPHPKDGGRYCFQFVSPHLGGGVPQSGLGGTPSQVWLGGGGYLIPGLAGGVPHPRSRQGGGGTPSQVRMGYSPTRSGWDTPWPDQDGVPPWHLGQGTPLDLGWGTPLDLAWGTPRTWDRVPPQTWDGVPPWHGTIVSTCYAVGSMPLAFMQEDFLVLYTFVWVQNIYFNMKDFGKCNFSFLYLRQSRVLFVHLLLFEATLLCKLGI